MGRNAVRAPKPEPRHRTSWSSPCARRTASTFLVLAVALNVSPAATAQPTASLEGRVLDASGAVVLGATITMSREAIGFSETAVTDNQGRYRVPSIPAGTYAVAVMATGFRVEAIEALTVEVGRTIVRDFSLTVGD